jgi:transposase-like protein
VSERAGTVSETHAPVLHCPYCAGEDLRPYEAPDRQSAWVCRECTRVFVVRLLGLEQQT